MTEFKFRIRQRFLQVLEQYHMIEKGKPVIAAVSGGADSMALLHLLNSVKGTFSLCAAHVNHMLRGTAAAADRDFVKQACGQLNIPLYIKEIDVAVLAKEQKIGTEAAGRAVRYAFLEEVQKSLGGGRIATAHHMDDNAETVLMHFLRGSSIEGLCGIRPVRGNVIRPMLCFTRNEIERYCKECGIAYCIDATNMDTAYTRNRIRQELLPEIKEKYNENIVSVLSANSDILALDADFLEQEAEAAFRTLFLDGLQCNKQAFLSRHPAIQKRLIRKGYQRLNGTTRDLSGVHVNDALKVIREGRGEKRAVLPKKIEIIITKDSLKFQKSEVDGVESGF